MSKDPSDRSRPFAERVFQVVCAVPAGNVTTYGNVGAVLGSPRLARQVGWVLSSLRDHQTSIPWHRVINARGSISHRGDIERAEEQRLRLEDEGVFFDKAGRCDLDNLRYCYPEFS